MTLNDQQKAKLRRLLALSRGLRDMQVGLLDKRQELVSKKLYYENAITQARRVYAGKLNLLEAEDSPVAANRRLIAEIADGIKSLDVQLAELQSAAGDAGTLSRRLVHHLGLRDDSGVIEQGAYVSSSSSAAGQL